MDVLQAVFSGFGPVVLPITDAALHLEVDVELSVFRLGRVLPHLVHRTRPHVLSLGQIFRGVLDSLFVMLYPISLTLGLLACRSVLHLSLSCLLFLVSERFLFFFGGWDLWILGLIPLSYCLSHII